MKSVSAMWPPVGERRIKRTSSKYLGENVAKILNEHRDWAPGFLIFVAKYYLDSNPGTYLAPQSFFGEMTDGTKPWEERVYEILTQYEVGDFDDEGYAILKIQEE